MRLPEKLADKIAKADFYFNEESEDDIIEIGKCTPGGHDFGFAIDFGGSLDSLRDDLLKYYQDFDVSYETYLWLGDDGHGKNGAPYDMLDVYRDMETCQGYIYDLYEIVDEYIYENEE